MDELRAIRTAKLDALRKAGMDPYPAKVPRSFSLADARANFKESSQVFSLAGRVMAIRGQGAILFLVLDDGKSTFQAVVKKDILKPELFTLLTETVDIGDIVSVTGTFFTTQKGEQSILVTSWTMAAKSLLPLPEKWHGLTDPDEKLRKRYLDLIMEPETRQLFYKKAKFWQVTRRFMEDEGFLEVETPTLETTTGGAEATPFTTHHNDFDMDVFLRISVGELWQKRLMAGGFPKTFEIGRIYRNEGTSPEHAQEFTNMEFYWSYADYKDGMELVTRLYRKIALDVFGTTKFTSRGKDGSAKEGGVGNHTFDLADEWVSIDYAEEIKKQLGVDINKATDGELLAELKKLGVPFEGANRERFIDTLWKQCRKNIAGPAFLVNHPTIVAPLAKKVVAGTTGASGVSDGADIVQMFNPIIAGSEIGKGYSELNDPLDQRQRFDAQRRLLEKGDTEAMMPDWDFVGMLDHGMPPTCGFGFGERLFAVLSGKPLRETQLFPLVKPKKLGA